MTIAKVNATRANSLYVNQKNSKDSAKNKDSDISFFDYGFNRFATSTLAGGALGTVGGLIADSKFEKYVYSKYFSSGLSISQLPKKTKFFFMSGIFPLGIAALGLAVGVAIGFAIQPGKDKK